MYFCWSIGIYHMVEFFILLGADAHVLGGTFGLDYYLNISYMSLNL